MARKGFVVWFTGLSGAGKTTLAEALAGYLRGLGLPTEVLDGDVVRRHFSKGLGFSREDREENIRRVAYVAHLLARNGVAVLVALISPYLEARRYARELIGDFVEVHVDCPLEVLVERDVKGLYARALSGELPNFTGVSDPYEPPENPEVRVRTDLESVEECLGRVVAALRERGYLPEQDGEGRDLVAEKPSESVDGQSRGGGLREALGREVAGSGRGGGRCG